VIGFLFQLHIAAANGYVKVMEFLMYHGVSLDPVDNDSWQPIHCAACWGQVSLSVPISQSNSDSRTCFLRMQG